MDALQTIVDVLQKARSLLVVTHARPDGDALGSMAAIVASARLAGKAAAGLVPDAVPARYAFLFENDKPLGIEAMAAHAASSDAILIVDTCSYQQLDGLEPALRQWRRKVAAVDHHATCDDVAAANWVDSSAAAAGVMVAELIAALGWPADAAVAEALATAIVSDTGWLHFANTDARCLRVFGQTMEAGVRPDALYRKLFQTDRPQRLALIGRMLGSLELHCGGRLAVMLIRQDDFKQSGARMDETENLVNEALRIGEVESSVLLVENPDGVIRVSLRSREFVDVARLAQPFGGGGHARAAGLRLKEDMDVLKRKLIAAFEMEMVS